MHKVTRTVGSLACSDDTTPSHICSMYMQHKGIPPILVANKMACRLAVSTYILNSYPSNLHRRTVLWRLAFRKEFDDDSFDGHFIMNLWKVVTQVVYSWYHYR